MRIGLIGCGKVGTTLFYLLKKNNQITGVYDINSKNEKRAVKLLHINKNLPLRELCIKSEALFFATRDDQIREAYKKVRAFINGKKYIFHFSGLLSAIIFPKSKNIYRCSAHPFATFPRIIIPPSRKRYPLFIEGDPQAIKVAKKIFSTKHFMLKKINKKDKKIYHLLGVFSSNLVVGLTSAIYEIVKKMNWKEKDLYDIIFPLVEESLSNIKKYKIKNALSGPLERGDIKIIKKHLDTLKKDKNLSNIYKTLSMAILHNIPRCKNKKKIKKLLS